MAVVARRNTIVRIGLYYLLELAVPIVPACLGKARLQEPPAASAAEVVGPVGIHFDEILFSHHAFDNEAQILGNGVSQ